jgi:hypothetical protein
MVPETHDETTWNIGELRRKMDQRHGEEQLKTEKLISGSNFGRRWRPRYCTVLDDSKIKTKLEMLCIYWDKNLERRWSVRRGSSSKIATVKQNKNGTLLFRKTLDLVLSLDVAEIHAEGKAWC